MVATWTYYLPEINAILSTAYSSTADAALRARAQLWQKLSVVRLLWMLTLSVILLHSLTKGTALRIIRTNHNKALAQLNAWAFFLS